MATQKPIYIESKNSAFADLRTKQYHWVKLTANGVELCSAATDKPYGILQNTPNAGESAQVMRLGVSKAVCGGNVAISAQIGTDANGKTAAKVAGTDTTNYVAGAADEAGVANDIISVAVNTLNVHRAA